MKKHKYDVPKYTEFIDEEWKVWFLKTNVVLKVTNDELLNYLNITNGFKALWEEAFTPITLEEWNTVNIRINDIISNPKGKKQEVIWNNDDVYLDEWTPIAKRLWDWELYQFPLDWIICPNINLPYNEIIAKMDLKTNMPFIRMCDIKQEDWTVFHIDISDLRLVN